MVQDSITFNISDKFTLSGVGGISGKGSLVKMGSGELVMNLDNSDYTGATLIKGGTLSVNSIGKAGKPSSLGSAATDASLLQILGGRLTINNENVFTDREIHISDSAFLNIPRSDGFLTLGGKISGTDGILIKEGKGQLNFFYNGLNPIKKLILRGGTIGQGEKGATLGTIPVSVEGNSKIILIMNTEIATAPCYNHPTEIADTASLTFNSVRRGFIEGSFTGGGSLNILTGRSQDIPRFDICPDLSQFRGNLHSAGYTRFINTSTDLSRTTLSLGDGASFIYYTRGTSNEPDVTMQLGSLTDAIGSSAFTAQPTFGGSKLTAYIGSKNEDATFSGTLKAKKIYKVGSAMLTLKGTSSTSPIEVVNGALAVENVSGVVTSDTITVDTTATICGSGTAKYIRLKRGSHISAGTSASSISTLRVSSGMSSIGAHYHVKIASPSDYDIINVEAGEVTLSEDTIAISLLSGATLSRGDTLKLFSGVKPTTAANIFVKDDAYLWSTEYLTTKGAIVCLGPRIGILGVGEEGYSTYYIDRPFIVPSDVKVGIVDNVSSESIAINYLYNEGDIVPASTGVIIRSSSGDYNFTFVADALSPAPPATNYLHGTLTDQLISALPGYYYYKLSNASDGTNFGFYWGEPSGGAFINKANKAYLAVPSHIGGAKGFAIDLSTGLSGISLDGHADNAIYTLSGVHLSLPEKDLPKGIYIIGGKKKVVK
jgi:autotransporter-associated beta strand protein